MLYFFFFFFSSRRRHTRSDRDWSSDVCSSDLSSEVVGEVAGVWDVITPATPPPRHDRQRGGLLIAELGHFLVVPSLPKGPVESLLDEGDRSVAYRVPCPQQAIPGGRVEQPGAHGVVEGPGRGTIGDR